MTLPKRGDRVRVTEFRGDGRPYRGIHNEVDLVSDASDAGDGFVSFEYQPMKGKPARVNAVKVEILERAASADRVWFITESADEDTKRREPGCKCQWEEGDSPCPVHGEHEEPAVHPEFARGMRRALAIAERLCESDDAFYHLANELKEAVEKELLE